ESKWIEIGVVARHNGCRCKRFMIHALDLADAESAIKKSSSGTRQTNCLLKRKKEG
ncbi:hypothetical protein ACJMK2_014566, partial [Sinanodonta woodiana]